MVTYMKPREQETQNDTTGPLRGNPGHWHELSGFEGVGWARGRTGRSTWYRNKSFFSVQWFYPLREMKSNM